MQKIIEQFTVKPALYAGAIAGVCENLTRNWLGGDGSVAVLVGILSITLWAVAAVAAGIASEWLVRGKKDQKFILTSYATVAGLALGGFMAAEVAVYLSQFVWGLAYPNPSNPISGPFDN